MKTNTTTTEDRALDPINREIINDAARAYNRHHGPRVGDILILDNGQCRRFAHDWGDSMQTTSPITGIGSFYVCTDTGFASYSGGLNPGLNKSDLVPTGTALKARFWIPHHGRLRKDCQVHFLMNARVYKVRPGANIGASQL